MDYFHLLVASLTLGRRVAYTSCWLKGEEKLLVLFRLEIGQRVSKIVDICLSLSILTVQWTEHIWFCLTFSIISALFEYILISTAYRTTEPLRTWINIKLDSIIVERIAVAGTFTSLGLFYRYFMVRSSKEPSPLIPSALVEKNYNVLKQYPKNG